ncbi:4Fe-4S binding protein [Spirochaetota bacterium]
MTERKLLYYRITDKCTNCRECLPACHVDAIIKVTGN